MPKAIKNSKKVAKKAAKKPARKRAVKPPVLTVVAPNRTNTRKQFKWMTRKESDAAPVPVNAVVLKSVKLKYRSYVPSVESDLGCNLVAVGVVTREKAKMELIQCDFDYKGFTCNLWEDKQSFERLEMREDGTFWASHN